MWTAGSVLPIYRSTHWLKVELIYRSIVGQQTSTIDRDYVDIPTDRKSAEQAYFFFAFYRRREKSARRARTTSDIFILSSNPHTVIKQISQWRCIVFVVVFSIQELNALFSMGLCGNFYLNHLIISLNVTRDECKSVWSKVVSIDKSRFDRRQESVRSKTVTIA